jgi:hypothetical protein
MKIVISIILFTISFSSTTYSQDLLKERIWKISERKRSIFIDKGVFHSETNTMHQELKNVRNSYVPARGYERIVFDFTTNNPPKVYGKIEKKEKKLYVDFFNTSMKPSVKELKSVKYLKNLKFFKIDKKDLSAELIFDERVGFDIFILKNPGRLVIDVKQ